MKQFIFKISFLVVILTTFSFQANAQFNLRVFNSTVSGAPVIVRVYDASSNLLYTSGPILNTATGFVSIATCVTGVPATVHIVDQGTTNCLTNISVNYARALDPTLSPNCTTTPPFICCDLYYNYFTTSQTTSSSCAPITYDLDIKID
jgi:hypothetical protein